MRSLQEIVSAALAGAGSQKVASAVSAADAPVVSMEDDFLLELDGLLGSKTAADSSAEAEVPAEENKKKKEESTKEAAAYGLTLARALTEAAHVVQKLALAENPQVTESGPLHATTVSPKAQSPGGPAMAMQAAKSTGVAGKLPNDGHEAPKSAADARIAQDPAAALRLLDAKLAAHRVCQETGQAVAAAEHQAAADALRKKLAEAGALPVSGGEAGSHVPDNAGMASLTKSQARDANTREGAAIFGVTPKKDNAVGAHVGHTEGQKVSSLADVLKKGPALRAKEAAQGDGTFTDTNERRHVEAHVATRGRSIGNVLGAAAAGAASHSDRLRSRMGAGRGAAVTALGSLAGGAVGKRLMRLAQKHSPGDDADIRGAARLNREAHGANKGLATAKPYDKED